MNINETTEEETILDLLYDLGFPRIYDLVDEFEHLEHMIYVPYIRCGVCE